MLEDKGISFSGNPNIYLKSCTFIDILGELPSKQGYSLLSEMLNHKKFEIRESFIAASLFLEMLNHKKFEIRESVIAALAKTGFPETFEPLKSIALDSKERIQNRLSAITGLGNIKTEQAVDVLLNILETQEQSCRFRAIKALGNARSFKAIEPLLKLLHEQERRKAQWREIRDENTDSYSEKQMEDWRKRLEAVQPKSYMEYELAYSISQIAPDTQGVSLLSHDLAAVRRGAWMGIGKAGKADLIRTLYDIRKQSKKPWERHAAYRAIDHLLMNIEIFGKKAELEEFGKKAELEELKKFFPEITDDKLGEGVKTRTEWTIDRLEEKKRN